MRTTIYLPDEDAKILEEMKALQNRSASNTIATLLKEEKARRFQVVDVKPLPTITVDGHPVPLVSVIEITDKGKQA